MPWFFGVAGYQFLAASVGMTVTVVLLDSSAGLVRDHPLLAWRKAGGLVGPLALLSLLCLFCCGGTPLWVSVGLVLPYTVMDLSYSWTWVRRTGAEQRRLRGREATILGLISLLFTSLAQGSAEPHTALVMAAFAGSAALFGGLGLNLLVALLARQAAEVEVAATPYGTIARITATGLGFTLMALLDTIGGQLFEGEGIGSLPLLLWAGFSLLLPLSLVAAGHHLFPRYQPPIWTAAMASALIGQVTLQIALSST